MKYLVISDVHGGCEELKKTLLFFESMKCDYIILLGDLLNHGPRNKVPQSYDPMSVGEILNQYKDRIISVRGNCDSEVDSMVFSFPCNASYGYVLLNTVSGVRKVFLTHGHLHKIETLEQIEKIGLKHNDIVLSGHTHVSGIFFKDSGIVNINPGSITLPKGGSKAGFAIMSEENISLYSLDGIKYMSYSL